MNFPPTLENPLDVLKSVQADMQKFQRDTLQKREVSMQRGQEDVEYETKAVERHDRPPTNVPCRDAGTLVLPEHKFGEGETNEGETPRSRGPVTFAFTVNAGGTDGQSLYVKVGDNVVCYYANPAVGNVYDVLNNNPPACGVFGAQQITYVVNFTTEEVFTCWWNQPLGCGVDQSGAAIPVIGFCSITNEGTTPVDVNGVVLENMFDSIPDTAIAFAGFGTGDQSAFTGGTVFDVRGV